MQQNTLAIGSQWVWVLDVVFGGIITLGYQELEKSLRISAQQSKSKFLQHVFVAASFVAFVIYDVGVYHVLIHRYPYQLSRLSGCRYVLDLMMAFTLLVILMRGLSVNAEVFGREILVALSIWHLSAAGWHYAASMEHTGAPPSVAAFLPHFLFIGIYWSVFLAYFVIGKATGHVMSIRHAGSSCAFLLMLATCVLGVSLYRSVQILKVFGVHV